MSDTEVYLSDNDKSDIFIYQTCPQLQNSKINGKIV